ncbi:MAG: N-acetylglucosamine-6-phosphate deacetylase [Flavobacteriaceae bacterium]|nr:N-acetylglucosamine-6-phosphate deacetylase [Flavobacteriaceae bacterium]
MNRLFNILKIITLTSLIVNCTEQKKELNTSNSGMDTLFYADGKPITIKIKDGKIDELIRSNSDKNYKTEGAIYVAPGLIDHQVNGYLSHSFVGDSLDATQVKKITDSFWKKGITTFLPTLTTESNEVLLRNFKILNEILEDEYLAQSIPGFHLEGPYISPVDGFRGAHNQAYIRNPNWQEFEAWYHASGNRIIEVTIAPELEGAMNFIKRCTENNIKVAIGHSNASTAQINEAVSLGASISTHLGNGCANTIHRHHNPIWPQLSEDKLYASLIVDGFHLTKEEVRTFYKVKGPDKTILVSDITRWAGMPPGTYSDFGKEVVVTEKGAIMMPKENVLAGASFLINRGIENIIKYTGCSLQEAIDMSTKNPAKALELNDRGEIAIGKRADIIYFKFDSGKLEILKTVVGGIIVYEKEE